MVGPPRHGSKPLALIGGLAVCCEQKIQGGRSPVSMLRHGGQYRLLITCVYVCVSPPPQALEHGLALDVLGNHGSKMTLPGKPSPEPVVVIYIGTLIRGYIAAIMIYEAMCVRSAGYARIPIHCGDFATSGLSLGKLMQSSKTTKARTWSGTQRMVSLFMHV